MPAGVKTRNSYCKRRTPRRYITQRPSTPQEAERPSTHGALRRSWRRVPYAAGANDSRSASATRAPPPTPPHQIGTGHCSAAADAAVAAAHAKSSGVLSAQLGACRAARMRIPPYRRARRGGAAAPWPAGLRDQLRVGPACVWHGWVGAGAGACQQAGAAVADLGGHERRDEHAHWTRRAKAHAELGVASAAAQRGTALPQSRMRSMWTGRATA